MSHIAVIQILILQLDELLQREYICASKEYSAQILFRIYRHSQKQSEPKCLTSQVSSFLGIQDYILLAIFFEMPPNIKKKKDKKQNKTNKQKKKQKTSSSFSSSFKLPRSPTTLTKPILYQPIKHFYSHRETHTHPTKDSKGQFRV